MRWGWLLQEKQETGCSIVSVGLLTVGLMNPKAVYYTHLDVYKRQIITIVDKSEYQKLMNFINR